MQQSKKRVCQNECLLTSADAVMAVAILAVSSDGKLAKREMDGLKVILASNPLFGNVEDSMDYMGYIASSVAEKGCDVILDMVTDLLTPSLRETAYAWAVYMVAADRKLVSPEHKFLEKLRKKLGIHVALVGKIKAVVPMLNRVK
ncbi:MAG: hypothetical protein A2283_12280 [Lentisphaerae bacterium RIFOXYA12_FULL_48_11]|nr:MAG: hypothetical protein A2283_12280 [Lentisphaerae bacterium RIFOXYA12_FULL_48_11]